jgi:hypothetical protein
VHRRAHSHGTANTAHHPASRNSTLLSPHQRGRTLAVADHRRQTRPPITGFPRIGHPNRRDKLTTTTAITTAAVETPASQRLSSERASTGVMSRLYHRSTELTQLNSSAQPGCARDDTAGCEQTRGLPRCSDRVNPWTGQTGQQ